jgi:PAS domain S-box-containing protein
MALLFVEPVIMQALVWTNDLHGLIWPSAQLVAVGEYVSLDLSHGLLFWIHAVYTYLVLLISTILLLRALFRSSDVYRGQTAVMLIAVVAPWIGNALYLSGLVIVIDLTSVAFTVSGLMFAWGLLRFQLLDLVPVARALLIESMADGVVVLDARNRIVDLNKSAAHVLGFEDKRYLGKTLTRLSPALVTLLELTTEKPGAAREIALPLNGRNQHYEFRVSPLRDELGRLSGRMVLMHDITEIKQAAQRIQSQNEALEQANRELLVAQQQAEESTRLKSQFLATMSHELRTPLNSIIGYTEIQLAGMTGPLNEEQQRYQERVLVNAEHLLRLINEILDLAKIEAGRIEFTRQPFTVRDWMLEIANQMEGVAKQEKLDFQWSLDPRLPSHLMGDAARLKQIALNLLSNAFKFTEQGFVKFDVRQQGEDLWAIVVSDSGIGIPPHAQEVIFEEFRQADGSTRRSYEGSGLGLAIVRRLAFLMGGTVRVSSQVGEGSTFTVLLPLMKAELEKAAPRVGQAESDLSSVPTVKVNHVS